MRNGLPPSVEAANARGRPRPAGAARTRPLRLLLLFEKEWDGGGFAPQLGAGEVELQAEGFDLFRFPSNARVLWFDAWRFVDRVCEKYRGRVDAVLSNNEQFGALLAAVVAQRLGLPGNDPAAVVRAQHKLLCRQRVRRAAAWPASEGGPLTEAENESAALPFSLDDRRVRSPAALRGAVAALGLSFPLFVKPVKATFSVLARSVRDADELAAHLRFRGFERRVISRLVAPYAQIAARIGDAGAPLPCDPAAMLLEPPCDAHQINVDGYAFAGGVTLLGIVDAHMYPQTAQGAKHFLRFAYPSRLPDELRARVTRATRAVLSALGFTHGFFNCEFFVLPDGRLRFIEVNPRLASQFVTLYRDVEGFDIYRMLVALAAGRDPASVPRLPRCAGAAASFVFRRFDGQAAPAPAPGALAWLAAQHPRARLMTYHKRGIGLAREYKWLGSHRYAVLNHSAADVAALEAEFERICARLGWPSQPIVDPVLPAAPPSAAVPARPAAGAMARAA